MKLYALTAAFRKARLYSYLHELYFLARAPASYPVCVWTPSLVPQIKQVEIYIHVSNQAGSNALNYITWLQNRWPWAIGLPGSDLKVTVVGWMWVVVGRPITLSLPSTTLFCTTCFTLSTQVEVELGCDNVVLSALLFTHFDYFLLIICILYHLVG